MSLYFFLFFFKFFYLFAERTIKVKIVVVDHSDNFFYGVSHALQNTNSPDSINIVIVVISILIAFIFRHKSSLFKASESFSRYTKVIFNPFHFISQRNHLLTASVYNIAPGAKQGV